MYSMLEVLRISNFNAILIPFIKIYTMKVNTSPDLKVVKGAVQPAINFSYSNLKERSNSGILMAPGTAPSQIRRVVDTKPHQSLPPIQFKQQLQAQGRQIIMGSSPEAPRPAPSGGTAMRLHKEQQTFGGGLIRQASTSSHENTRSRTSERQAHEDIPLSPQNSVSNLATASTNPAPNMLRQQRVLLVDESDYKLELEVIKIKYKNLEERYEKVEAELQSLKQRKDQFQVIEEEDVPSSSDRVDDKGRMSEIIALRVDQELQHFKAQTQEREQQIKAKYEEYFARVRSQNDTLTQHLKDSEERIAHLQRGMTATEDLHMDRALKERDEQLHILKGRLAENQRKIADYQRNFAIMEVEIQRCNAEIIKKNSEILTFKNAANANSSEISSQSDQKEQQLKVAEMQMDQLKENIKSKQAAFNQLIEKLAAYERQYNDIHQQKESLKQRLSASSETVNRAQFEFRKAMETIQIKDQHVNELNQEREKLRIKIQSIMKDQTRDRDQSRSRISQLEHKIIETQTTAKEMEQTFRGELKRQNQANRDLTKKSEQKDSRIKSAQQQIRRLVNIIEKQRTDRQIQLNSYEQKLFSSQKCRVQIEGKLNQVTLQLQLKRQQLKCQPDPQAIITQLKAQICQLTEDGSKLRIENQKKNAELDAKRIEFESNMRKFRQECEDSYRDTLRAYEERIQQLQRKRHKRREHEQRHQIQSSDGRHQPSHQDQSFIELQQRISDFLDRINQLIEDKPSNTESFKTLIGDLNIKIKEFKNENSKLRHKISKRKHTQNKLKEYEQENKKLMEGYGQHGQKVQQLVAEVNRLRALAHEYELAIYHGQVGRQFAPKGTQGQLEERIKMLEEKAQFYKEKNTDMESRINNLINMNSSLKIQLQQATKVPVNPNIDFLTQQMARSQQNAIKLQQQVRSTQQQAALARNQSHLKIQQVQKNHKVQLAQLEAKIVQLNLKISGLKSEKTICQNDLKLIKETLEHRETMVEELSQKLQAARRELADFSVEIRRKQELQAALREANTKLGSISMEKSHLENQNSSAKKHNSYLERELLQNNQKLSALSSSHLALQLQLTQVKTTLCQSERRVEDMQQEIRSLQRYKTDSESSSSGDRTRIGHLETKLRDLYYELEKANKEKDAAALELGVVKSHYAQQKEQLVKLGQDKKEAEMELNRLRMVALPVSNNRPPSSNKQEQLRAQITHLESTLALIKNQLMKTQAERAALDAELQHIKDVVEPQFTNKIRELEEILEHVSVSVDAHTQSMEAAENKQNDQSNHHKAQLAALTEEFKKLYHRSVELEGDAINAANGEKLALQKLEQTENRIQELQEEIVKLRHNINSLEQLLQQKDALLHVSSKEFEQKLEMLQNRYKTIESLAETTEARDNFNQNSTQQMEHNFELIANTAGQCSFFIEKIRSNCVELEVLLREAELRQEQEPIRQIIHANIETSIAAADQAFKISEAIQNLKSNFK